MRDAKCLHQKAINISADNDHQALPFMDEFKRALEMSSNLTKASEWLERKSEFKVFPSLHHRRLDK